MANLKFERSTASERVSGFVTRNRVWIITLLALIIVAIISYIVYVSVVSDISKKGLSYIDSVEYELTQNSSTLLEAELETRRTDAMNKLTPYLTKGRIVGVRANMLAAEISFSKKDYAQAKLYWEAAAEKSKKSYTAPLAYFNVGVCAENIGELDAAIENYEKAANAKDFLLVTHAMYSQGRVYEEKSDFAKAAEVYTNLTSSFPNDTWAKLAKTKLIDLRVKGKIE